MGWVWIDDDAPRHPKIMHAGDAGFGFFTASLCYANRYRTDGFIPVAALPAIFPSLRRERALNRAVRLVEAGLWETREGGWQIHDYTDYQPTKAMLFDLKTFAKRGGNARASSAIRDSRGQFIRGVPTSRLDQQGGEIHQPTPTPTKETTPPYKPPKGGDDYKPGFCRFWTVFPKKVGKDKAAEAWRKKRCEPMADAIVAAIEQQRAYLTRDDGQFIPNPATWINQGRWKDEPPPLPPNATPSVTGKPTGPMVMINGREVPWFGPNIDR